MSAKAEGIAWAQVLRAGMRRFIDAAAPVVDMLQTTLAELNLKDTRRV